MFLSFFQGFLVSSLAGVFINLVLLFVILYLIVFIAFVCNISKTKAIWLSYIVFLLTTIAVNMLLNGLNSRQHIVNSMFFSNLNLIIIYGIILLPMLYIAFNYVNIFWRVFILLHMGLFGIIYHIVVAGSTLCQIKSCVDLKDLSLAERFAGSMGGYATTLCFTLIYLFIILPVIKYIQKCNKKNSYTLKMLYVELKRLLLPFIALLCIVLFYILYINSLRHFIIFLSLLVICVMLLYLFIALYYIKYKANFNIKNNKIKQATLYNLFFNLLKYTIIRMFIFIVSTIALSLMLVFIAMVNV